MDKKLDLELDLDIKCIKAFIKQYSALYKCSVSKFSGVDKVLLSRLYFIKFQLRNIFDNGIWL